MSSVAAAPETSTAAGNPGDSANLPRDDSPNTVSDVENPDTPEPERSDEGTIVYDIMAAGFASIQSRQQKYQDMDESARVKQEKQAINNCAVVSFVDPSSSPGNFVAASGKQIPGNVSLELYKKVEVILQRDYASRLTYVQYQHFRSGANGMIESLPIRPILSLGGLALTTNAPWDDTSSTTLDPQDPTEWHNAPYCHIYLAGCESLEDYRNKVKPSLKAFVSQLNALAIEQKKASGSESPSSRKENTSHYVIVFVPTGSNMDETLRPAARVGAALSRFSARSRKVTSSAGSEMQAESAHSGGADSSDMGSEPDLETMELGSQQVSSIANHLSKVDREIVRRFVLDFPHGKICTLSTLIAEGHDEVDDRRKLEWSAFMKAMGSSIAEGFAERCRRYDEYLRKVDSERALSSQKAKTGKGFDLTHFFLVKESYAISYEQMQLVSEALLQYNELRAFIPDIKSTEIQNSKDNPATSNREMKLLENYALAGRPLAFRRMFRTHLELDAVAPVLEQYVFSREVALLFKIGDPVAVVERSLAFVNAMFQFKGRQVAACDGEEQHLRRIDTERWAFGFCWDLKRASQNLLVLDSTVPTTDQSSAEGTRFARQICSLLEFARARLLHLRRLELVKVVEKRTDSIVFPNALEWKPYQVPNSPISISLSDEPLPELAKDFLEQCLVSATNFDKNYLGFMYTLVAANQMARRHRTAARRRQEIAEILLQRGDKTHAARAFKIIADSFSNDNWDGSSFVFLFRLAVIQRDLCTPEEYLRTLIRCFSHRSSSIAPIEALNVLQEDMVGIITRRVDSTSDSFGYTTTAPSMFSTVMTFVDADSLATSKSEDKLNKRLVNVGETTSVFVALRSFLPHEIRVDNVSLDIVQFKTYVSAVEDAVALKSKDAFKILNLGPTCLSSGTNNLRFDWLPLASGQFIAASVTIHWMGVKFAYPANKILKPTLRVDVVPCQPSQSINCTPTFLLPGHEQVLRIGFNTGSDVVKAGTLQLIGSPGLSFIPLDQNPDTDKWVSSCSLPIPHSSSNETLSFSVLVRSSPIDKLSSGVSPQSLHVKLTTSFEIARPDSLQQENPLPNEISIMPNSLENIIMALGEAPLALLGAHFDLPHGDTGILNISVKSHVPELLTIKKWSLKMPDSLTLVPNGDLNSGQLNQQVCNGDTLAFGFLCQSSSSQFPVSGQNGHFSLSIELDDQSGTAFVENLEFFLKPIAFPAHSIILPVSISVRASKHNGVVGSRISLFYSVDENDLLLCEHDVFYAVDTESIDWIVCGKTEGILKEEGGRSLDFSVEAIPTRPGSIASYPHVTLRLNSKTMDDISTFFQVSLVGDSEFKATSPAIYPCVAFMSSKKNLTTI
jgi:hypothetical protein